MIVNLARASAVSRSIRGIIIMRAFVFEADIYKTLECVPMAVRGKLDRAGIKVSLAQWQSLAIDQRRRICEFPSETPEQVSDLAVFLRSAVLERCGEEPALLSPEQRQAAFPPAELPLELAKNAALAGFGLNQGNWAELTQEERYALMKLGGGRRIKRNFEEALKELFSGRSRLGPAREPDAP